MRPPLTPCYGLSLLPPPPSSSSPFLTRLAPSLKIPNFAYLISAAYSSATGGGYDKLEVYKCSDGAKAPAVTGEMVIRFPSCMVSWRHKEFHMVIQMLHLNLPPSPPLPPPEPSSSTELHTRLASVRGSRQRRQQQKNQQQKKKNHDPSRGKKYKNWKMRGCCQIKTQSYNLNSLRL